MDMRLCKGKAPLSLRLGLLCYPAADDEAVPGMALFARFYAQGGLSPRSFGVDETNGVMALSSPMRVIHGIHGFPEHRRSAAHPTHPACFSDDNEVVLEIGDSPDRGIAALREIAHLPTWKLHLRIRPFERHEGRRGPCSANHRASFTYGDLDIMNLESYGDVLELHAISHLHFCPLRTNNHIADFESIRREHVPLLAILIENECEVTGAIGIVFDRSNRAGNSQLIRLMEINNAQKPLMTSPAVPHRDATEIIASGFLALPTRERFLRLLLRERREIRHKHVAASGGRWFKGFEGHSGERLQVAGVRCQEFLEI